jgi:ribose transport system permease protein
MSVETTAVLQETNLSDSVDCGNSGGHSSKRRALRALGALFQMREMAMVVLIFITCIIMSIFSPYFLSIANFLAIARGFSMEGIVVVGMVLLLISGNFDLSVGSVMALSGIAAAALMVKLQLPAPIAVCGGLAVGAVTGAVNGFVVTKIGVNPLVATLGMMAVARGLALGFTSGHPVIGVPIKFAWIGQGSIAGLPVPVVIMMVVVFTADILLRKARAMRQLYYVGGSVEAAKLSGINVNRVVFIAFVVSGICAAMAGVVSMARLTSGVPTAFVGVELRIIAACVIGGASLSGGEGSVLGALLGLIFMALVTNAMTLFGVSIYWEGVITGSILTAAVSIDMLSRRKLKKY